MLELLGEGGMGEVYVGFDETLQRRVALKAIHDRHRLSAQSRARFLREARILSQLDHPNICRIYNFIDGDDTDYLVLELIEGEELHHAVAAGLGPAQRTRVAIQIAEVLAAAHGKGVVHRDLKPHNVMVTPEGETKVLDFGLARSEEPSSGGAGDGVGEAAAQGGSSLALPVESSAGTALLPAAGGAEADPADRLRTQRGQIVGTPVYMSPEQARGEVVTTASDMYSFGLVLQTLFSGAAPYPEGLDSAEILGRARRAETLPVRGIDKDLTALIERLKSPAPAARPTAVAALERLRWIRDKPKRRLRRLIAAAVLALIAVGIAKYTSDLKKARDRAERRREQAESLIGFMIGDLRSKLAPVNRLEVLDEIGEKALAYFAAVPAAELSAEELLFRSRTLSQIGQVRMAQGDLAAAMEAFEESLVRAEGLVERNRENSEWLAWLGAAHFWVGFVDWKRGDPEAALTSYRAYLEISRELVERDPENLDWQLELSYAHNNIGSVLSRAGSFDAAAEAFRASLEIKRLLVERRPDNLRWKSDLAGSHAWLGSALLSGGDLDGALGHYETNLGLLRELVATEPDNTRLRWLLGIAYEKVGSVLEMQGRAEEALRRYQEYLAVNRNLVEQDGENSSWQRELAVAHYRVGNALGELGELAGGQEHLAAAESILRRLVALDGSNAEWSSRLAQSRIGLASVLGRRSLAEEALEIASQAVETAAALAEADPGDSTATRLLGQAHLERGELLLIQGRADDAATAFQRALESIRPVNAGSIHPLQRETRARALLRLGRIEEARPLVAELHRLGFHHRRFERLCREIGVWP